LAGGPWSRPWTGAAGGERGLIFPNSGFHCWGRQCVICSVFQGPIQQILVDDLLDPERLDEICRRRQTHYWSQDWSPEFYILLAKAGFISVCLQDPGFGQVLIPEMQSAHAVLDWQDRHCERSMRRWQRSSHFASQNYRLSLEHDFDAVVAGIHEAHGEKNWLQGRYVELLRQLVNTGEKSDFRLIVVGLLARDHELIGGEVGYQVGKTYTSLSGFLRRENPIDNHAGKLQLHLLAEELERRGFAFWNLGHPGFDYKVRFGAKIIPRGEFLKRWLSLQP